MPEQDVEAYLRTVPASDRMRAAAWDAVYAEGGDEVVRQRIRHLPFSDAVKADLWELAHGNYDPAQRGQAPTPAPAGGFSDVLGGLRSSAARTVYGGGDLIRRAVGMDRIINDPESQAAMTAPASAAGTAGSLVGDVGQFFLPTGVVGKMRLPAEMLKSAGLTMAQTGSPSQAVTSAAIAGAAPAVIGGVSSALTSASGMAQRGAEKTVSQALGATKETMKAQASKLAPEMLRRGVRGSRASMLAQAEQKVAEAGKQIGDEVAVAAAAGQTVSGLQIRGALQLTRDGLMVPNAAGTRVAIPGTERVIQKLSKLETFVESLGDDIPFDKAQRVKQTLDRIVSKAGLYTNKATASATDTADAWATREAASVFRELLASGSAKLDDLNKEFAFWQGLRNVLRETQRRTQAQSGGLASAITGAGGMAAGLASGDSLSDRVQNAVIGGLAGRQLVRAMQSPWWRTAASGPAKQKLADALASGIPERIQTAMGRVAASIPGQATPAPAMR